MNYLRRVPWGTLSLIACGVLLLAFCLAFGLWLMLAPAPAGILCC